MIRYALQCDAGHGFESWFADGAAFDSLSLAGQLSCPFCGSAAISKALMVPSVRPARNAKPQAQPGAAASAEAPAGTAGNGAAPAGVTPPAPPAAGQIAERLGELEQALAALRRQVEENSEYVGGNFAAEARRIHDGDAPERAIYGEAKPDEARKLVEDGVQIAPLPFVPRRKTN